MPRVADVLGQYPNHYLTAEVTGSLLMLTAPPNIHISVHTCYGSA